jgi:hypothetical protein
VLFARLRTQWRISSYCGTADSACHTISQQNHEMRKPSFEIYVSANLCPLDDVNGTKLSVYMWG